MSLIEDLNWSLNFNDFKHNIQFRPQGHTYCSRRVQNILSESLYKSDLRTQEALPSRAGRISCANGIHWMS